MYKQERACNLQRFNTSRRQDMVRSLMRRPTPDEASNAVRRLVRMGLTVVVGVLLCLLFMLSSFVGELRVERASFFFRLCSLSNTSACAGDLDCLEPASTQVRASSIASSECNTSSTTSYSIRVSRCDISLIM